MGYKLPLTNLQNVAPGNIATLKCPVGQGAPTYDQIRLELSGGMTPAHLEYVRGKANGRIFMDEGGGLVVNDRDDYRAVYNDATAVVLDFTEVNARNGAAEQLLASVPGSLLADLAFEIKIAAGAPANGRITAVANYRPPTNNPFIRKMLMTTESFPGAGTSGAPSIFYLPVGGNGGKIKRVWIHESIANNITGAQIRIANNVVHEVTRARVEHDQKRNKLVPQAGVFVLDFIEDGNLAGMLDTGKAPSVELRLETGAGGTYTVYYEFIDPIGRL
jgi:hypothetical protein